jgi:hypothetical protein
MFLTTGTVGLRNGQSGKYVTKSKGQSLFWEADIPYILRNPNFHYRVHKSPQVVPTLKHINPIQDLQHHLSKICFNIILPSKIRSSK